MPSSSGNPCSSSSTLISQSADIIDAYASVLLNTLLSVADEDDCYQITWVPMPAVHCPPVLEKVRSLLLGPTFPALSSELQRFLLLEADDEAIRLGVIAALRRAAHFVMGNEKGVALLGGLLLGDGYPLLQAIVEAVTSADVNEIGFQYHIMAYEYEGYRRRWLTSVNLLAKAVAPHPELGLSLVAWLHGGVSWKCYNDSVHGIMVDSFFDMACHHYPIVRRFIITNIDTPMPSKFGSILLLEECFKDLYPYHYRALEEMILDHTSEIAKGEYSHNLLCLVIEYGMEPLQDAVAKRVAEDVLRLSADPFGSCVVEACICIAMSRPLSKAPLKRVLDAVLALDDDQFTELLRFSHYSNRIVRVLLKPAKKFFPDQRAMLRKRILKVAEQVLLPAAIQPATPMLRAAL